MISAKGSTSSLRVAVLGATGMLGHTVVDYLASQGIEVVTTQRFSPEAPHFLDIEARDVGARLASFCSGDGLTHIVNCAGATRVKDGRGETLRRAATVNAEFPHLVADVAKNAGLRVIHISTDGVFANSDLPRTESMPCDATDAYGLSKIEGEARAAHVLNVRTSIIGRSPCHDPKANAGARYLLDWFLDQRDGETVTGFDNHLWTGVTTLQLAQFIHALVSSNLLANTLAATKILHFVPNVTLSKFELLLAVNSAYGRKIEVKRGRTDESVSRKLVCEFEELAPTLLGQRRFIGEALIEFKKLTDRKSAAPNI